jgi:outer membrane protein OmpA-like peptidoglycan-associated protein
VIPGNKNYGMNVAAEGYLFYSENFSIKDNPSSDPYLIDVPLKKIKTGQTVPLYNILFDVNKYVIKQESTAELERLFNLLTTNSKIRVEIGGHTDNSGAETINQPLSQNRAKAVYDWLITKGIAANRLTYKGYGSSVPIMPNTSDEGKRKNRRTEIKVL